MQTKIFPLPPQEDDVLKIVQGDIVAIVFVEVSSNDGHIDYCYVVEDRSRNHNHRYTVSGECDNFEDAHLQACIEIHKMFLRARRDFPKVN